MTEIDYGKVTGMIHSTESFGSVDGPGVRFVIFMQGCKMRCKFCHNPDTWAMTNGKAKERTVDDVLAEAIKFKSFWGSRGGITVSGGEAMLQMEFVTALFTKAKTLGIHCTLDTCGQPFSTTPETLEKIDRLLAVTDLVLLDIKEINGIRHRDLTGHQNDNIIAFSQYLSDKGTPVWIRHVLVPGETDFDEDCFLGFGGCVALFGLYLIRGGFVVLVLYFERSEKGGDIRRDRCCGLDVG